MTALIDRREKILLSAESFLGGVRPRGRFLLGAVRIAMHDHRPSPASHWFPLAIWAPEQEPRFLAPAGPFGPPIAMPTGVSSGQWRIGRTR